MIKFYMEDAGEALKETGSTLHGLESSAGIGNYCILCRGIICGCDNYPGGGGDKCRTGSVSGE